MKLNIVLKAIDEKKAEHIVVYDFEELNPSIDKVIICSASNHRQVHAIADNIEYRLKEQGYEINHMEGDKNSNWILVDCDDIIVHIFSYEERNHYQLDKLYVGLPCEVVNL